VGAGVICIVRGVPIVVEGLLLIKKGDHR
jgi:hypothetical protein